MGNTFACVDVLQDHFADLHWLSVWVLGEELCEVACALGRSVGVYVIPCAEAVGKLGIHRVDPRLHAVASELVSAVAAILAVSTRRKQRVTVFLTGINWSVEVGLRVSIAKSRSAAVPEMGCERTSWFLVSYRRSRPARQRDGSKSKGEKLRVLETHGQEAFLGFFDV